MNTFEELSIFQIQSIQMKKCVIFYNIYLFIIDKNLSDTNNKDKIPNNFANDTIAIRN